MSMTNDVLLLISQGSSYFLPGGSEPFKHSSKQSPGKKYTSCRCQKPLNAHTVVKPANALNPDLLKNMILNMF